MNEAAEGTVHHKVVGSVVAAVCIALGLVGIAAAAGAAAGAAPALAAALHRSLAVEHPAAEVRASLPHAATHLSPTRPYLTNAEVGDFELGTTFSSVSASWVVPTAQPQSGLSRGAAEVYVGIGGAGGTQNLIVTSAWAVTAGRTVYLLGYDDTTTTPGRTSTGIVTFAQAITPGDSLTVSIRQESGTTWRISVTDNTRGWSTGATVSYGGDTSSADWFVSKIDTYALAGFPGFTINGPTAAAANPGAAYVVPSFIAGGTTAAYVAQSNYTPGTPFTVVEGPPPVNEGFVSPAFGPTNGGNLVKIYGTWLVVKGASTVHFATVDATGHITSTQTALAMTNDNSSFTANGRTVLAVVAPGGTGTKQVVVDNAWGGTTRVQRGASYLYGTPAPAGYDLVGSDGGVFVFPPANQTGAGFYGSLPQIGVTPNLPVVGMVPTITNQGYFLVAQDGGVFSFGNAPFLGSLPGLQVKPNAPIVGIVAADTDKGYFLVGKDGGVYAFGTVPFLGSLPGSNVATDAVIGIAATPSGHGYWVLTSTGTVYAFGAAQLGSVSGTSSPQTAIAGTPTGNGYWVAAQDGHVHSFGNAGYFGTLVAIGVTPAKPVIGIVHTASTAGYWLIGSDGGIFAFGVAPFAGSLPGANVHVNNIVAAVPIGVPTTT